MKLIRNHSKKTNGILSIHNQESEEENKLFREKSGKMRSMLEAFGLDLRTWISQGQNSLPVYFPHLNCDTNTLLVHNTYSSIEDINSAQKENVFWCLCPNANIFIENTLPNISLFSPMMEKITLGTDSLASNNQLSIWEEIKTLKKHYKEIPIELLIQWGTYNGAAFLGIQNQAGSIEKGKKPGLVLLENYLSDNSHAKRIL
jgi:cytosine/adenosine deaminase-related metal-dependent hydrolase